jgi:hypothetical protein
MRLCKIKVYKKMMRIERKMDKSPSIGKNRKIKMIAHV